MVRMSTTEEDISFEVKQIHDRITLGIDREMYYPTIMTTESDTDNQTVDKQ